MAELEQEQLLYEVREDLRKTLELLKSKLSHENLEKVLQLTFNLPTLLAKIQEAEALSPMESDVCSQTLRRFLQLKTFVYEIDDSIDKLRVKTLMSQEQRLRGKDLIGHVSSLSLHGRGWGSPGQPEPDAPSLRRGLSQHKQRADEDQPEPDAPSLRRGVSHHQHSSDERRNPQMLARVYEKVKSLFWSHKNNRINISELEQKFNSIFNEIHVHPTRCPKPESSYISLACHLKLCFKYFTLIPNGYCIEKDVFTQLWMAEGFINPPEGETAVGDCFDELLCWGSSFFKDIEKDEDGNIVRCKIDKSLPDIGLSGGEFSVIRDKLQLKPDCLHSSLHCVVNNLCTGEPLVEAKNMRTFLFFGSQSDTKVSDLASNFKLLRVLDLSSSMIEELPNFVAKLEHLRYLNLSNTLIKKLGAFICNLYLLQTLKLSYSLLSELPRETWKLQNLRHLEIDGTPLNHLPPGIHRLTNIQNLSEFIVGGNGGCSIRELKKLQNLQGRLIISHLDRVIDHQDAGKAELNNKSCIKHLILDGKKHLNTPNLWCKRRVNSLLLEHMCDEAESNQNDDGKSELVFECINPNPSLKKLEIWNYLGSKLPKWLEGTSLSKLVSLKVAKCLKMEHMPYLGGLPSLKFLHIYDMAEVKSIEFQPKKEEGYFPCLLELILSNCPKLKAIPALPQTLKKLEIHDCKGLEWNDSSLSFPTVEYLVLKGKVGNLCSLPDAPNLASLTIALSSEMASFPDGLDKLKGLSTLSINFCPRLSSLPVELKEHRSLKRLHIAGCRPLTQDWSNKDKEVLKKKLIVEVVGEVYDISNMRDKSLALSRYGDADIRDGKEDDFGAGDCGYRAGDAYDDISD